MSASAVFKFRAVTRAGHLEEGLLSASSREAAVRELTLRGSYPVEVRRSGRARVRTIRVRTNDLALGLRALSTLLNAGLSVSRTLDMLEELVPPAWHPALPGIRERVVRGERLADAMEASMLPLPGHVLGVVRAGEAGSGLARALSRAADMMEARAKRQSELRSALSYPVMLAVAGGGSVALLVGVVLPRFVDLLGESGQSLPWTTQAVLMLGAVGRPGGVLALFAVCTTLLLWRGWLLTPTGPRRWHAALLRVPLIGPLRRSSATANGCSALSAMLESGVPLSAALPHAAHSCGDAAVAAGLEEARTRIVRGSSFADALEDQDAFTSTAVRLVRVGQETGELAHMLDHAARIEADGALTRMQRLIRLVEPTMILLFGGLVILVAAGLLQAMYSVRPMP